MRATLVYVRHEESKCPLRQDTADWADRLADNLEGAKLVGFFQQQEHQGGVILPETDHTALTATVSRLLPEHLTPEFVDVEVNDASPIALAVANPGRLDCATAGDADARTHGLELADAFEAAFGGRNLTTTRALDHKTVSLRELPAYLRANAPHAG